MLPKKASPQADFFAGPRFCLRRRGRLVGAEGECYDAAMKITALLLHWYDTSARRLPFRGTADPYRVWLSEIMLQQTRTGTVGPYYLRFLERFPDVKSLARAEEREVLKLWEGLGYYSRARNLHRAARLVAEKMDGRFPQTMAQLMDLPGVGPYTAAAIASIAFKEPVPAMDGNLSRVIARLYLVEEDISRPEVRRRLYGLGRALMPLDRPGDMNQALMDLGATICLPGTPDCGRCPLAAACRAFQEGEPDLLPVLPRKKAPKVIPMAVCLLHREGRLYVAERKEALLKGLCVFYLLEGEDSLAALASALALPPGGIQSYGEARHVFTHRVWRMRLYSARWDRPERPGQGRFVTPEELGRLPFPTAMRAARALVPKVMENAREQDG